MVKMQHHKNIRIMIKLVLLLFQAVKVCGWEHVAKQLIKLCHRKEDENGNS